jgi:hypothetical protein
MMAATIDWPHPIYIRLGKGGEPVISAPEAGFEIGKAILMREPGLGLFVSTGVMTQLALKAAEQLQAENIPCGVLHMHTVKPLDGAALDHWLPCVDGVVTVEEHTRIVEREHNPERKAFYKMAWHLGASQSDLASLKAEDVDWDNQVITFFRMKTKWRSVQPTQIRFGKEVEAILKDLPKEGLLFPYLATVRAGDRATEFKQRCDGLGIKGISMHSYRYGWAERAQVAGYPERFAQKALGHNSKAVHRAYARRAQVTLPPLEEYEAKIIPFNSPKNESAAG